MTHRLIDATALTQVLRQFASERNWERFHSPKNLAMALSVEVAELVQIFQWCTEVESRAARDDVVVKQAAADEIADVIIYATRLADKLDIDINEAVVQKLGKNAQKHPATPR
jgi:dCTP diphosphatase